MVTKSTNRRTRSTEAGQAFIITVVLLAAVLVVLVTLLFTTAVDNQAVSSTLVERSQSLQSAQSGVDTAYQALSTLPLVTSAKKLCPGLSGTVGSYPRRSTYTVHVTYYSNATSDTTVTCTQVEAGTVPKAVLLKVTGADGITTSTMQSLADLAVTAATEKFFPEELYVGGTFPAGGNSKMTGAGTAYVAKPMTCHGNMTSSLSFTVGSTFKGTGNCSISGTVDAIGAVTLGGNTSISGKNSSGQSLITTSTVSVGAITVKVSGSLNAKHKITYPTSWSSGNHGTIASTTANVKTPATPAFPTLKWTLTGWTSLGYTAFVDDTCTGSGSVLTKIKAMATATKSKAIYTTCKVTIGGVTTITLKHSLALFSAGTTAVAGGFKITSDATIKGASTTTVDLYLVVPDKSTGSAPSCASPAGNGDITLTGNAKITSNVDAFIYSPCTISVTGNGGINKGQIYGDKTVTFTGNMALASPTSPPGASSSGNTSSTVPTVGIVYERESNR